ncbi:MAG: urea ABC transporter ATP-binding subunit UrtE [Magnetococcales bacterium]|nr:urea ABC transporter ATP-binding subunit UrtE [Magnetococcales bacterium]NGZ25461.1 urea ABC transporter ATP-binding subunit UrtE [Magnetococcales bacterium]
MLKVENLDQYYGGSHILRQISFAVPAGKVTTLLGRNGVGKSTLMRCLMGLVKVKQGRILMDGKEMTHAPSHDRVRAGLGYVPQGREIFPRLTVEENLLMGLASKPAGTPLPSSIYETFPVLWDMRKCRGGDLSGGQQQQLAIGRALAASPRLLILDEPTEGIQPSIIKDIEKVIRHLTAQGSMSILLVEQYYDFARALADHYLLMERGEMVMAGLGEGMEQDGVRQRLAV